MSSLKKPDTTILTGYQIFHNDLGPHLAIEEKTAKDLAGIKASNRFAV